MKVGFSVFFWLGCALAVLSCADPDDTGMGPSLTPQFTAVINNNPPLQGDSFHGQQVDNRPLIWLRGDRVSEDGSLQVAVYGDCRNLLFSGSREIKVTNGVFSQELPLLTPLPDPRHIYIRFQNRQGDTSISMPIVLRKLYGKVTDFQGRPLPAYLLVSWDIESFIGIQAGHDGHYVLWLPEERIGHIFVADAAYGKTSLEAFIGHNFVLRKDAELSVHIDRMELYNVRSWASLSTFNFWFIPMALPQLQDSALAGKRRAWPRLEVADIKVFVNDEEIGLQQFEEVKDFLDLEQQSWRPAYIGSFGLNPVLEAYRNEGQVIIRIQAEDRSSRSKGEAFLINPSID